MGRLNLIVLAGCMLVAVSTSLAQDGGRNRVRQEVTFAVHRSSVSPDQFSSVLSLRKITVARQTDHGRAFETVSLRPLAEIQNPGVSVTAYPLPSEKILITISD